MSVAMTVPRHQRVPQVEVEVEAQPNAEPTFADLLEGATELSSAELDERLERAARQNERSEMELCAYLVEVNERKAHRDFGFKSIYDYVQTRFQFGERKTRYLISLGRKLRELPKLRQAMKDGKLGWSKAARLSPVVTPQNEALWLDSALSMTVNELESRIKDGTDSELTGLHFWLDAEQRKVWELALEIFRRRAGADISPAEAFEYMAAEVVAQWGDDLKPLEPAADDLEGRPEETTTPEENELATDPTPLFPHAAPIDLGAAVDPNLASDTGRAIAEARAPSYDDMRMFVLERDGWKCTYPGCNERSNLHVHHVRFRGRGGGHEPWNLTVVCEFHHGMLHREEVQVRGRAPLRLDWTPPKLMREALARAGGSPELSATG